MKEKPKHIQGLHTTIHHITNSILNFDKEVSRL